ncbi:MAG: antibiotic biosynthesis monooxygenase [Chloroflexi bacterium]|nr:antibiotic biosynthesis monooxygenase [Chloroflexota bacterium]
MAVRVLLELKAKPGTGDDLASFFRSILPDTRAYEGCVSVDALRNGADADNLVLVEVWETREHYEKYLAWRRERGDSDQLAQALAEPPNIRHFDLTDA